MGFLDTYGNKWEQNPAPQIYMTVVSPISKGFEPSWNGAHVPLQGNNYQLIAEDPLQGIM